jgi:UDP-N-acetylmuramoyl-tripeptide--D-alanyl-D-alanine ligase
MKTPFYGVFLFLIVMKIEEIYKLFTQCSSVCTDTRNIKKDSLFIALKGDNFDGNKFSKEAITNGSKFALVDNTEFADNEKIFFVSDTLLALQNLARFHREKFNIPVVAITGTNGKTTTKELISIVLQEKYNVTFTKGNLNNHIGVPLTLLEINVETQIAVIEMGANHPGEIKTLCEIALPNYGIITNIGKAHLEGFGSLYGVINTKTEMYRFVKKNKGKIFINTNNEILLSHIDNNEYISYGESEDCYMIGKNPSSNPFLQLEWKMYNNSIWNTVQTNLVGNYNFENVLAAICIGNYFEVEEHIIIKAINNYKPTNNRSQIIKSENNTILIDAYNANPTSMFAALESFFEMKGENKVLIIGDMLELGKNTENEHKNILQLILQSDIKEVFLIGKTFVKISENSNLKTFESVSLFKEYLKNNPLLNKQILIKGSHGIHLEELIPIL